MFIYLIDFPLIIFKCKFKKKKIGEESAYNVPGESLVLQNNEILDKRAIGEYHTNLANWSSIAHCHLQSTTGRQHYNNVAIE